jgi:hypothetical protein
MLFTRHYGEPSHALYLYGEPTIDNDGYFSVFFSGTDTGTVRSVFPEFGDDYEEVERDKQLGFRSRTKMDRNPVVAVEFSNVVRYKPAFWMKVLDGTSTGAASIVEAFCNLVERRFPYEVLESIWNERFSFGGPAYLG